MTGPQGTPGNQGPIGKKGQQGAKGRDGPGDLTKCSYGVRDSNGNTPIDAQLIDNDSTLTVSYIT